MFATHNSTDKYYKLNFELRESSIRVQPVLFYLYKVQVHEHSSMLLEAGSWFLVVGVRSGA